ncbi:sensor histidine kinase [Hydrogenophaga sp. OTU3427]|uniref:sensor histidine kinase n=1 Tax=Hydrogenophaga sp. OTU3427 TaxID=3043856 RepID=UPI00313AF533
MSWSRIRQASLKLRLLVLLLPVMALVTATSLWLTRTDAAAAANAAYDRSLLGAIKALDNNVSTASGGLAVELPYRLFEFFQLTATGSVYFRVATADGLVEIGHPDLPLPAVPLKPGQPVFYDAVYFGETVRVGTVMRALEHRLDQTDEAQLVIQVAESTASREQFTASFLRRTALRDAVFLAVMGLAVVLGLWMALRPLTRLAAQTRARDAQDVRPLPSADLPSDVRPLVDAVNQQLARSEQLMAQRRGFVDDASHQLRTPLTLLRAQLDYVLRETDTPRREAALRALSDALGQAIRATNQLLTLARSDTMAVHRERFDLGDLARQVALELLPLARERGVDFGLEVPDPAVAGEGDPALLRQALLNLAHNAIQHGRAQGVVTLKASADATGHRLEVLDDGEGLEPALRQHIGERFAKGRHSTGSGLGMAIARSVIESHGGRLEVQAAPGGVGLCVTLWWPR